MELIKTKQIAVDDQRVIFRENGGKLAFDLPADWTPPFQIVQRFIKEPEGVQAVRIREIATGVISTISAESAKDDPRIRL